MFALTKQERQVLVFLALVFFCGTLLQYFSKKFPKLINPFTQEKRFCPKIDVNRASQEDLEKLPLIGKKSAQQILALRREKGVIRNLQDLEGLPGMTAMKLKKIGLYLKFPKSP